MEFLETGKRRLPGDTEPQGEHLRCLQLRRENEQIKQVVAELMLKKKQSLSSLSGRAAASMRYAAAENLDIIRLEQDPELGVNRTLAEIDAPPQLLPLIPSLCSGRVARLEHKPGPSGLLEPRPEGGARARGHMDLAKPECSPGSSHGTSPIPKAISSASPASTAS